MAKTVSLKVKLQYKKRQVTDDRNNQTGVLTAGRFYGRAQ